jgi:RNA polymerase sigma-70 factor (ECF subfamily)
MPFASTALAGFGSHGYHPAVTPLSIACGTSRASGLERRGRSAIVLEETLSATMAAAQAGDAEAYRLLLRDCMPVIAAAARAKGVRGEAVEDVVQDTLLTVHRARASYDPARPFLPWLRAIAHRRAIDLLRRQGRRPKEIDDPIAYEAHPDEGLPEAGQGLEARERETRLAQAVAALPEGQRQAVEQLGLRENSLAEASALTGRSTGALKVNLHRALKTLRAALAKDREDGHV